MSKTSHTSVDRDTTPLLNPGVQNATTSRAYTNDSIQVSEQTTTKIISSSTKHVSENSDTASEQNVKNEIATVTPELGYSPNVARLVSMAVLILHCMAIGTTPSLVNQYLADRWRSEAGHNRSELGNLSRCDQVDDNITNAFEDELNARVSTVSTDFSYVSTLTATVTSFLLGSYADIIGRRVIILSPAVGVLAQFILVICIMRFSLDVNFFYLSSAIIGLGGSIFAMLIGVFTVTADVNAHKGTRVLWLALNICVSSVVIGLSSIGIGFIIKYFGYYQASAVLTIPAVLCFFVAFFFLPETCPKNKNSKTSLSPLTNIRRVISIYTKEGSLRRRICLWICLSLFFFGVIPDLQLVPIDTIYQMYRPLCWDSTQIGFYGALQVGGKKLTGTILLKTMQWGAWIRDEKLAMAGTVFQAGSMVLEALVTNSWQMYLVPVVGIPAVITVPVVRGIMSFLVGPYNQGALFASIAFVETLCSITAATAINKTYTSTVAYMPGAVYFLMASFAVTDFFLFLPFFHFYHDPVKSKTKEGRETTDKMNSEGK